MNHQFTAYLQSKNIKEKNIKFYTSQVFIFTQWLQVNYSKSLIEVEKKDILNYLQYLQGKSLSNRTRQQKLGILKHYFCFLHQSGQVTKNPTTLIKLRGVKKKWLVKTLSVDEMNELLDTYYQLKVKQAIKNQLLYHRNYLILSLCVYQGLKRDEFLKLNFNDIDLQKATIHIKATHKTNARTLPLHVLQMGIFYQYLNQYQSGNENGLLLNLYESELQKLIKEVKQLYPKFTSLKQLRASLITYWIQSEGLRKAQYKAGHRYISSTEEYLAGDIESLQNDINRYHPL